MNTKWWDVDHLSSEVFHPRALRLAYKLIYGWFLLNLAFVLPHLELVWGSESVIMRGAGSDSLLANFIYQLVYIPSRAGWIIGIHAITSLLAMFSFRFVFIVRAMSWGTGLMLYFAAYPAFNSGYLAILLFAFFLIFTNDKAKHPLHILLTNLLWFACFFQLIVIYAISAGYKWTGTQWPSGTAIYYSFAIDRFSYGWLRESLGDYKWLWMVMSYAVLIYQSLFPILAWVHKWRAKLILTGIVFHLMIAVLMNLWTFGLAMILAYVFLLPEGMFSMKKEG